MKRFLLVTISVLLTSMLLTGCSKEGEEGETLKDKDTEIAGSSKTVAVVDGVNITERELAQKVDDMLQRSGGGMSSEQLETMRPSIRPQALANLISYKLLLSAAESEDIASSETEIKSRTEKIMEEYPSEEDFYSKLEEVGMSRMDFKERLGEQIRVEKLLDQKTSGAELPSEQEIKDYYDSHPETFMENEQVRASHILITVEDGETEQEKAEKRERLENILKDVRNGASFSETATLYSDCPSKEKGGDLGFFSKGDMVKPFSDAAFAMKEGEISDIVETRFGYHIINLTDRKEARKIPFDEAKKDILEYMEGRSKNEAINNYLAELREKADIEYADSSLVR